MSNNPWGSDYQGTRPPAGGTTPQSNEDQAAYRAYVQMYPDLMADYEKNWAGRGVSIEDYGSMHYYGSGKDEGRQLGGPAPAPSGGGGGGGSSQNAMIQEMQRQEQAAKAAEDARKAEIEKNNAHINAQFDAREGAYDQYADDLYKHNLATYDESANKARRETDFALARTGNTGGSVEADTQGSLESLYQDGLTNLKSGSRDAANSLRAKDNQQRNALLSQSASGTYNMNARSSQPTFADTSMTSMSAGVGNQFQSLLGGIGGASKKNNPFGYGY